jgi:hypothetical protein
MSQLRAAMIAGREAFLRELTKPGSLVIALAIGGTLAIVNLIEAYKERSVSHAITAVVIWLVFVPLLARWMYSKRRR